MNRLMILAVLALAVVGCIPSRTPPHLANTPGPDVQVAPTWVTTDIFRVARPAGWRAITSAAAAPPSLIFVAPNDTALILLTTERPATLPVPTLPTGSTLQTTTAQVPLGDHTVYIYLAGASDGWDSLLPLGVAVAASVTDSNLKNMP